MVFELFKKRYLKLLSREKAVLSNRSVNFYEILLCPYCMRTKFIFEEKKKEYICPNCKRSISKQEFKEFAKIEELSAILFDFNKGKSDKVKIFDHHGEYVKDILRTATSQVIVFLQSTQSHWEEKLKLEKKNLEELKFKDKEFIEYFIGVMQKIMKENYKFCMTNHLDIDSVLSIFAFRNPIYALRYASLLNGLSQYNDILTLERKYERYYLIFYGLKSALEKEKKSRQEILNYFLLNLKDIFANPLKYQEFANYELRLVENSFKQLAECDKTKHFTILSNFDNQILEFKVPKKVRIEMPAFFKFLSFNKRYNLPFIIRKGRLPYHFSFSVNTCIKDFENINLNNLKSLLVEEEKNKINYLIKHNKENINYKKKLEFELDDLNKKNESNLKIQYFKKLIILIQQDRFNELKKSLNLIESKEDKAFLLNIYKSILEIKNDFLKEIDIEDKFNFLENLNECLFNDALSVSKNLRKTLSTEDKRKINSLFKKIGINKNSMIKRIKEIIEQNSGNNLNRIKEIRTILKNLQIVEINDNLDSMWIIKANMIMTNLESPPNLTYEEFLEFLEKNLNKVYNN